jgi:hemolysin III
MQHTSTMHDREELANVLTHGAGALLSIAGGATLIVLAALQGDAWLIVGSAIFASALLLLYTSSTLYHAARSAVLRRRFKVLDHCAIYVLIAGTYTPFMLDARGGWGWSLFGVVWGLAAAGIAFKLFFTGRFRLLSTLIYVAMGWLVLVGIVPLTQQLHTGTLLWLLAGGVTYTAGTLFYHWQRLRFSHAIWHGFVLGGSVCHAIAVATLVAR